MSYADQLAGKERALAQLTGGDAVRRSPRLFLPVADVDCHVNPDGPRHFRQKVAFVFASGPGGRGLVMGHYERGSHRVVPVEECPVHSDRGNRIAFALRDRLAEARVPPAGPQLAGILRHLIVRTTADDGEAVAMLVVTRNEKSLRKPVRALLDSADAPDGFYVNIHDKPGSFMVGAETIRIAGHAHVREDVGGITFQISPTAFFQTNVRAARALQQHVVESVQGAARVLDLYCGSGLFSLRLASSGVTVTGVEENRQAAKDAGSNAALNRIPRSRVRFLASRVEDALRSLAREKWDAVLLDPPRQGCTRAVLEQVFVGMAPPLVTYISCNPEALARELPFIQEAGYSIGGVRAVDMFPHTEHIETIVQLARVT
jgi:23S rRNA (uracil1939-C5)-methyltransferase